MACGGGGEGKLGDPGSQRVNPIDIVGVTVVVARERDAMLAGERGDRRAALVDAAGPSRLRARTASTWSNRSSCIAVVSSIPIPPAPTTPSTTAERVDDSNANSDVATKAGRQEGNTASATTAPGRAPVARRASSSSGSTSSIDSAKNRPQNPATSTVIASTPAGGPRPTVTTKMIPQTMSGAVRNNATIPRARP